MSEAMNRNESEIIAARRAIFQAAQGMLAGSVSYIEGARRIHASMWTAKIGEWDPDLVPFVGIVSETDALPSDQTRPLWQAAALEQLQPEIDRCEAWAQEFGEPYCRNLVQRFVSGQIRLQPPF
ncbi:hypothetical protein [Bradyrhizobium neotropicale]|uniref:hypothetical protein n=1 Tax=Bradyrhizobium neotropicale TaxID=1497615 RepID=UPI001AD699DD|nr:hypothetical protein [Bradyrhizobium neotropicale]MBO4228249.1 DUF2489 domain-containing protein [Bradyrhizobium neotropicale]